MKSKLLLHVCCAICGSALAENLKDKYALSLFFYNPNIHPQEEYIKRRNSVVSLAKEYGLDYFEGPYKPKFWFAKIKGFEEEPEGGERCSLCFKMRLRKTALFAEKNNFDSFSTTLAQSHLKDKDLINGIGRDMGEETGINYIKFEKFPRKKDLERNFYHQNYCGCLFSKN